MWVVMPPLQCALLSRLQESNFLPSWMQPDLHPSKVNKVLARRAAGGLSYP